MLSQRHDGLFGQNLVPGRLLQLVSNGGQGFQCAQDGHLARQAKEPAQPGKVVGTGDPVDEHAVDPVGQPGKMEISARTLRNRDDRDDGQVKQIGDRLQLTGQVAFTVRGDFQRFIERSLHHGELGAPHPAQEEGAANRVGHQPGIKVPARQSGHLTGHVGGRGTGACPEMLNAPALLGKSRQEGQSHHGRFGPRGRGRQSQPRNIHHRGLETR